MDDRLDILTSISGMKITNIDDWEKFRRPEIMILLENFVYGVRPYEIPENLEFVQKRYENAYLGHDIRYKEIEIRINHVPFDLHLFLPQSQLPVPVFLFIENEYYMKQVNFAEQIDYDFLPICEIVSRGYGVAVMPVGHVSPDWPHHSEFKKGVFAAMQPNVHQRTKRSWATISGWAFGASRVMDYLERDIDVEHSKVAIIGHSRCGKTALWAGATDPRFALVIANSSGCTGAAYTRGKKGEHIKDINISDWFCDNYHLYNDREEMLPLDQHMLLSLIAPRPLYIKSDVLDE
ncbi:MAG: acetylxylan esterase, partial [Clostridia bacterium]